MLRVLREWVEAFQGLIGRKRRRESDSEVRVVNLDDDSDDEVEFCGELEPRRVEAGLGPRGRASALFPRGLDGAFGDLRGLPGFTRPTLSVRSNRPNWPECLQSQPSPETPESYRLQSLSPRRSSLVGRSPPVKRLKLAQYLKEHQTKASLEQQQKENVPGVMVEPAGVGEEKLQASPKAKVKDGSEPKPAENPVLSLSLSFVQRTSTPSAVGRSPSIGSRIGSHSWSLRKNVLSSNKGEYSSLASSLSRSFKPEWREKKKGTPVFCNIFKSMKPFQSDKRSWFRPEEKRAYAQVLLEAISPRHSPFLRSTSINGPKSSYSSRMMSVSLHLASPLRPPLHNPKETSPGPTSSAEPTTGDDEVQVLDVLPSPVDKVPVRDVRRSPTEDIQVLAVKVKQQGKGRKPRAKYGEEAREREAQLAAQEREVEFCAENRRRAVERLTTDLHDRLRVKEAVVLLDEEEEEEEVKEDVREVLLEREFPQLTPEMENEINAALHPIPATEVLVENYNIPIKRSDVQTLKNLNWLNDEVINYYFNLIMNRSEGGQGDLPRVYCTSTFFYPRLNSGGYSAVKRWTRKVDIFSKDLVLVPVHLGMHWTLAVIDMTEKGIRYYDSMGHENSHCLRLLLDYIQEEYKDKKKAQLDVAAWSMQSVREIPQQKNGSDCGMFACKFADFVSRRLPIVFDQEHMPYFRRRMVFEILQNKLLT
ncbi:unnamed protein product [Darwinula stevensoni]|uniref:Ubiquitin-like protease family profile domain-containing protein n=1 Tax=Darwinula stevensoni TaxID=69355 RepID=A0A7R9A8A6_9CRUS|nr:unnamed protein product [Darwinula stevensoni]CAG0896220.1 unnamed protein product [Darwinula stevensoni]